MFKGLHPSQLDLDEKDDLNVSSDSAVSSASTVSVKSDMEKVIILLHQRPKDSKF